MTRSQDSVLFSPRLEVATIEIEALLGLWLLSGWSERAGRLAALAFFVILASASLFMALAGQRSCGCFGPIAVSPWLAFAFDVSAVGALATCRPSPRGRLRSSTSSRWVLLTGLGAATLLIMTGGAFFLGFENPIDALARLRGDLVTVEPPVTDVGEGERNAQRSFSITLKNHTDQPVRVYGGTASCYCLATEDLPITLLAGESRSIEVKMVFRGGAGRFQHRFVFYADAEGQREILARFAGRLLEPSSN